MKIKYEKFKNIDSDLQESEKIELKDSNLKLILFYLLCKLYIGFLIILILYPIFCAILNQSDIYLSKSWPLIGTLAFIHAVFLIRQTKIINDDKENLSSANTITKNLIIHSYIHLFLLFFYLKKTISLIFNFYEKIGLTDFILIHIYMNIFYYIMFLLFYLLAWIYYKNISPNLLFKIYSFYTLVFLSMCVLNLVKFYGMTYPLILTSFISFIGVFVNYLGSFLAYKTLRNENVVVKILLNCWRILMILNMFQEILYFEILAVFLSGYN
ncbi:hypothetical protein TUBRATIS_22490 [Tubulinosema ratisbonensis]|uniref:Uncharacterized protein n=1 Tax=Tubulinosema ratisbonensis TaxID=291195 RepID=A0A437AJG5_9MICR|nr:hypothetical protein TUBRATIS_22490 [Tubulinosema ratisbonensis]